MKSHTRSRHYRSTAAYLTFACLILLPGIRPAPCSASGNVESPQAILSLPDDHFYPALGFAAAISGNGDTLVLGGPQWGSPTGAAYVFVKQAGGGWVLAARLNVLAGYDQRDYASDSDLGFCYSGLALEETTCSLGFSVAINYDGSVIVLGAPGADTPENSVYVGGGAVFVFDKPNTGWTNTNQFAAKLTNSDGNFEDQFGASVSITNDGGIIVVGSPEFGSHNLSPVVGKAYLYIKPPSGWETAPNPLHETSGLVAAVGQEAFGVSVAISGDGTTIAGGAPEWAGTSFDVGRVYVFAEPNGGWPANTLIIPSGQLLASDGSQGDAFGSSLSITDNGSAIVVGAPKITGSFSSTHPPGEAYVFIAPKDGWVLPLNEDVRLLPPDGGPCDTFGGAIAISGNGSRVVVGSKFDHSSFNSSGCVGGPGATYIFDNPSWLPKQLVAPDGKANDEFGAAVSADFLGDLIAVGAPDVAGQFGPLGQGYIFLQAPLAALSTSNLNFNSQPVRTTSLGQTVRLTNNGTEPMTVTVEGLDPGFQFQGGTPNCIGASPLAPGTSCDEYIVFAPTSTGPITGTLSFQDNSGNVAGTQQTVSLSGTGVLAATTITITAVAPSPAVVGQTVTVSFSVGWGANAFNPSGNVSVTANPLESCMGLAVVDNCALSFATYGTRTLTATYAGDSHFNGSTSTSVNLNVGDFSISALPASITVPLGSSGSSQITVGSLGGFSSAITLAASEVPAGVTAAASPSSVSPPAGGSAASTMTVNVGPSITPTNFSLNASGAYGALTHSVPVSVTVVATPASVSNVVNQILSGGCIDNSGISNGFKSKLAAAQSAISAGKIQVAVNMLAALLNQLQAQSGKHVSTSCTLNGITFNAAAALIMDVQSMITALNLMPNPVIGYVANGSGIGLAGATVSILSGTNTTMASATTDSTGFYYFPNTAIFSIGTNYTAKSTALPSPYKSTSPPSQTFTWQGTLAKLNAFTAN